MTKARIDWMSAGKVKTLVDGCEFVSLTYGKYINSSGTVANSSVTGAHVAEYRVTNPAAHFLITHYNPNSSNYTIAYYNSSGRFTSGRRGNTQTLKSQYAIDEIWFTTAPATIRVYGIYDPEQYPETRNKIASITTAPMVFNVEEIRVKAEGDSVSQIVWPLFENYIISSATLDVVDSIRFDGEYVMRPSSTSYCYATGTVQHRRGTSVIETFLNVPLTAVSMDYNSSVVVDGETKQVFKITTKNGRSVITGVDMRTTLDTGGFSTNVTFTYQGLASTVLTVKQSPNTPSSRPEYVNQQDLNYRIELSTPKLEPGGGDVTVYGYLARTRTPRYQWTSWAYSYDAPEVYDEAHLTSVSVSPTPTRINGAIVTLPPNSGTSEISYTITGYYSSYHADNTVVVYGSDSGHTYSNLSVSASYDTDISAGGGGVYPTVSVSIKQDNSYTLTGTAGNGATSLTVSNGSRSTVVSLSYSNGVNGFISAESRGSVPGPRQEIASCRVDVSKVMRNGTISASSTASAWQAANVETITLGDFNLTGLSVVPLVEGQALPIEDGAYKLNLNTAFPTTVYVQVLASGSGTTTKYEYTSGIPPVGGESVNLDNDPVTPRNVSVSVGLTPVTVTNQEFSASNVHTTDPKTFTLSATYESGSASSSMIQIEDEKIDSDERNYTVTLEEVSGTNTLSAAGGEVKVKASASYTTGKVWKSDGTSAEEGMIPTYDLDILSIVATQNVGYTRITDSTTSTYIIYKFQHRDMKNNKTTDPLEIYAKAGNYKDTSANPLSYSVSNYLVTSQTYEVSSGVVYGENYPENEYYANLSISNYTSPSNPAPFSVQSVISYNATGYHIEYLYHDGIQTIYRYQRYTSWTALYDDDNHRELVGVIQDTTTYYHRLVAETTYSGDQMLVESSANWLTVNSANNSIIIAAQGDNDARSAKITATNTADTSTPKVKAEATIYQSQYAEISADPTSLIFDPVGGTSTFVVSFKRINWVITSSGQGNDDPITRITPTSGGGSRGSSTISVSVSANNTDVPLFSEILVSPNPAHAEVAPLPIDVMVKTATVTYDYIGTADCAWVTSTKIRYSIFIQNRKANAVTFTNLAFRIRSTTSAAADPSVGQSERLISLGTVTVPGGDTITLVASGETNMPARVSGRYYFAAVEHNDIHSTYTPFEEDAP